MLGTEQTMSQRPEGIEKSLAQNIHVGSVQSNWKNIVGALSERLRILSHLSILLSKELLKVFY